MTFTPLKCFCCGSSQSNHIFVRVAKFFFVRGTSPSCWDEGFPAWEHGSIKPDAVWTDGPDASAETQLFCFFLPCASVAQRGGEERVTHSLTSHGYNYLTFFLYLCRHICHSSLIRSGFHWVAQFSQIEFSKNLQWIFICSVNDVREEDITFFYLNLLCVFTFLLSQNPNNRPE